VIEINEPIFTVESLRAAVELVAGRDADDDPAGNDWRELVAERRNPDLATFVSDLFVLCRSTPELFGGVQLDGHMEQWDAPEDSADAYVSVAIVIDESTDLRITGRRIMVHEFFGSRTELIGIERSVACLQRIGEEAAVVARTYASVARP
jgi:hypothetical protein